MGFTVVTASAGSGKTYSLTQSVLELLLAGHPSEIDRVLALTFTNKAANEMKEKLLKRLKEIAEGENFSPGTLPEKLKDIEPGELRRRARETLDYILFHYDDLHYSTIDRFTFGLIKQFARELGLSKGVNVEMNENEAVDVIVADFLNRLSEEDVILEKLLQVVEENLENDKNWDVEPVFADLKNLILPDKYHSYIHSIRQMPREHIAETEKQLRRKFYVFRDKLKKEAEALKKIIENEIFRDAIKRQNDMVTLVNKLIDLNLPTTNSPTFKKLFFTTDVNPILKKASKDKVPVENQEEFLRQSQKVFRLLTELTKTEIFLASLRPFVFIHAMVEEIEKYKRENEIIFISDFNKIINRVIHDNPAPFIYFRAGEKYFYHYIDEFQDTSRLQWENMKPLIAEALSKQSPAGVPGQATLYGDAKQSIYRFRGAEPEQFIRLTQDDNPFPFSPKNLDHLEKNWRSRKEIVEFNNRFFGGISPGWEIEEYHLAYHSGEVTQEPRKPAGGYVEMHLADQKEEEILESISGIVRRLIDEQGYSPGDICILYNTHEKGAVIDRHLVETGYLTVSPDTLQLDNSPKVNALVEWYRFRITGNPADLLKALKLTWQVNGEDVPGEKWLKFENAGIGEALRILTDRSDLPDWERLPLYAFFSALMDALNWKEDQELAYVKQFMSAVNRLEQSHVTGKEFLTYWDKNVKKVKIEQPPSADAIQLMTVHKAKGLEFPVVIYAFANQSLPPRSKELTWIKTGMDHIPYLPVNYSDLKKLTELFGLYENEYRNFRDAALFDKINRLYVAFTRPKEQLYVLAGNNTKGKENVRNLLRTRMETLLPAWKDAQWNEEEGIFRYGTPPVASREPSEPPQTARIPFYAQHSLYDHPVVRIDTRKWELWSPGVREAVRQGVILHYYLSKLKCKDDLPAVRAAVKRDQSADIAEAVMELLENLVRDPQLDFMFDCRKRILTERSVLAGSTHRPDRIIFDGDNEITLVDYKTGEKKSEHTRQLQNYARLLEQAGFRVNHKYLLYLSGTERELVEVK